MIFPEIQSQVQVMQSPAELGSVSEPCKLKHLVLKVLEGSVAELQINEGSDVRSIHVIDLSGPKRKVKVELSEGKWVGKYGVLDENEGAKSLTLIVRTNGAHPNSIKFWNSCGLVDYAPAAEEKAPVAPAEHRSLRGRVSQCFSRVFPAGSAQ
jgi:hypothetical protein